MKSTFKKDAKAILSLVLLVGLFSFIWPFIQAFSVQKPAVDFSYQALNAEELNHRFLETYQGQPVILHFWATWCQVCEFEVPEINKLAAKYPVLNIAGHSGEDANVKAFARKYAMDLSMTVNDQSQNIQNLYGVVGFPTTVLIDASGTIRWRKVGKVSFSQVESQIQNLD